MPKIHSKPNMRVGAVKARPLEERQEMRRYDDELKDEKNMKIMKNLNNIIDMNDQILGNSKLPLKQQHGKRSVLQAK